MKIFYDGDCYFCKNYVEFAKLQARVGDVALISLRSDHEDVADVFARGFRVNRGFVIEHNGEWFEGDKAFSYLNLLLNANSFQAKLLIYVSRRARLSIILYRLLVFGRFATLLLQGLSLLDKKKDAGFYRYKSVARLTRIAALLSVPLLFLFKP